MPGISIDWQNFDPTQPLAVDLTSECIDTVHYNPRNFLLTIAFQDGRVYEYSDVPHWTVYSLVQSASPGRYFNAAVRDVYAYEEI